MARPDSTNQRQGSSRQLSLPTVGTWFLWNHSSGLHGQWKACPMWCSTRVKELRLPGCLNVTQRCENRQETQVSTPIGHSGPHDLWGHRAYTRPGLPFFNLFPNPSEGRRLPSHFSCIAKGRSRASPANIFSSHPTLHGGELQLPAHLTKETSSQPKLYQPPSRDAMSCRRTSKSNWAAQLNRNQQDDFTELRMAQQLPFCPFQGQ